jgi:hypothetical protein
MMNEILHQELVNLQKDLSAMQTARLQLETLQTTAQKVVESVQSIQTQYATHLPEILASLTENNAIQFGNLQAENKQIMVATANTLLEKNQGIAQKYETQYTQIQGYLAQYQAVVTLTTELESKISAINFPEKFQSLETVVTAIHHKITENIADLKLVKLHNDQHLVAVQEAHQYYLRDFYQKTAKQFAEISEKYSLQNENIIQDFRIVQEETQIIFEQQKQNFHLTLQQVEQQINKVLQHIVLSIDNLVQKIAQMFLQIQQDFATQQQDIRQFLLAYQGLVEYTKAVENKILAINFPQKLETIATQISNLEKKIDENQDEHKQVLHKQFAEIEAKMLLYKKQQDTQYQLIENQNLLTQTQNEQIQRHLQQHLNELHKAEIEEFRQQTDFLQQKLVMQDKMLQYLLIAIVSVGMFSVIGLLWTIFKS